MKRWILIIPALYATAFSYAAFSPTGRDGADAKRWTINVGGAFPTDSEARDAGFDILWFVGADYRLGVLGNDPRGYTYLGAKAVFGTGDEDYSLTGYGVFYGGAFPLDNKMENPLLLKLEAGYFDLHVENKIDEKTSGFGGGISLLWENRGRIRFELGHYWFPSESDIKGDAWYFGIGFPIGN